MQSTSIYWISSKSIEQRELKKIQWQSKGLLHPFSGIFFKFLDEISNTKFVFNLVVLIYMFLLYTMNNLGLRLKFKKSIING